MKMSNEVRSGTSLDCRQSCFVSGLYLQYEDVCSCCTDQNFALDFQSSPCQTFLRQPTHKNCFIFVHVGLSSSKLWSCNIIRQLSLMVIFFKSFKHAKLMSALAHQQKNKNKTETQTQILHAVYEESSIYTSV